MVSLSRERRSPLDNRSRSAVFLCYHSIADSGPPFMSIPPDTFERHLAALKKRGYRSGTSAELSRLAAGERLSGRYAFISFDDGYIDNCREALPLLKTYGFTATFFVLPPFLATGAPLEWHGLRDEARGHPQVMRSMDWSMVGRLREAGCEVGSHTLTHPRLSLLDDEPLAHELDESRRLIVEKLGSCDALAYPFGDWSPRVAHAAAAAGYRFAFSLPYEDQATSTPLSIPRVTMDHRDDPARFRLKLAAIGRSFLFSRARPLLRRGLRRVTE